MQSVLRLVGSVAVALDAVLRSIVLVVMAVLVDEFWAEPEPNSDGLPVALLIPVVVVFGAWNIWILARSGRRWLDGMLGDRSYLSTIGLLSIARLVWLMALADDWWWHHRNRLAVLMVASVICAVLALGPAIGLARDASSVDDEHHRGADVRG